MDEIAAELMRQVNGSQIDGDEMQQDHECVRTNRGWNCMFEEL